MPNLDKYRVTVTKHGKTETSTYLFHDEKMGKRYGALQVMGKNHGVTFVEVVNLKGEVIYSFGEEKNVAE